MSRLATWIDRVARSKNLAFSLFAGIVDDGSGGAPDVGEPSPLRVDSTTGAVLVKDTSAASQTVTAAPEEGATGGVFYSPQLPPELEPCQRDGSLCFRVVAIDPVAAIQGDSNGEANNAWSVVLARADGTTFYDAASVADVEAVRDRLPADFTAGGGVKVGLVDALPAGANAIGSVSVSSSALPTGAAEQSTLSALNDKIPASPAQEHVLAASPHAARLSDGSTFYVAAKSGDNLGADIRVAGSAVANANPVPISDAAASITTDTPQLPAALVGGRLAVDPSGVTQPISAASLPLPTGAAQEHVAANSPHAVRLTDGSSFLSASNALPTRPDVLGRALDGSTRTKGAHSISYVRHAPASMVSLGGTSARHEFMDQQSASGGTLTYLPNTQSVRLAVPAAAGARQSYRQRIWNPYKPGSPMRPAWNFVADTHRAGVVYRAGPYDDFDGLYVERNDTGTFFVTRSYTSGSVVNTPVALPGVDISFANLYRLAYEWFGAGDRELVVNGALALAITGGGNAVVPYMRRPNLPLTFEIVNDTGANASYLDVVCIEVENEGEQDFLIRDGTYSTNTTSIGTGGKMLFQGRPAASIAVGTLTGLDNRGVYIPRSVTCSTTGGPAVIRVYDNGSPTGSPSWAASSDDAGMEFDVAATFVGATGRLIGFGTIDNATGTTTIDLTGAYRIPGRALSAGAYSGQDSIQAVGFSRTGSVSSLDTIFSYHRIG